MRCLAAIAVLGCGLVTPALATEWINCASADGQAEFNFLPGNIRMLSIGGLRISAGEMDWVSDTAYSEGEIAFVGQAFETVETILIDATNSDASRLIASLRLFKTQEGRSAPVYAGTLRIPGHGAWAVSCSGP